MRVFTGNPVCATLALVTILIAPQVSQADPAQIVPTETAHTETAQTETARTAHVETVQTEPVQAESTPCERRDVVLDESKGGIKARPPCVNANQEATQARAYLIETARPGNTMARQGADVAIGRLHPDFVVRLADAIREARQEGLDDAGIFSAYRPPAFGVGGFSDKFNSLHAYGLAVDMNGIGKPGSDEAAQWHRIAAKHGVVCPYGSRDRAEWNHCQPTSIKIVRENSHLRDTITAQGPRDLQSMFDAGTAFINNVEDAAETVATTVANAVDLLGLKLGREDLAGKTVIGDEWCDNSNALQANAKASRAERRAASRSTRLERRAERADRRAAQRATRANARMARHAAAVIARKPGKKVRMSERARKTHHVRTAHAGARKSYRRSQARLRRAQSNSDS
jgi:hypothetical protein